MGELSSRFSRTKQLFRRSSATNTTTTSTSTSSQSPSTSPSTLRRRSSHHKLRKLSVRTQEATGHGDEGAPSEASAANTPQDSNACPVSPHQEQQPVSAQTPVTAASAPELTFQAASPERKPQITSFSASPRPDRDIPGGPLAPPTPQSQPTTPANLGLPNVAPSSTLSPPQTSNEGSTRDSTLPVLPANGQRLAGRSAPRDESEDYFGDAVFRDRNPERMAKRKIWVKRVGQSATLVQIAQDDLVDDVRDMIIRKYANSLGRTFDAPDVVLRITPREKSHPDRILGPEEEVATTLEAYYPGGQHVEEALIIEVPQRRTPRPSPSHHSYDQSHLQQQSAQQIPHHRPAESGTDYFPQMPAVSPGANHPPSSHDSRVAQYAAAHPHSISILETGQAPPLPSPRLRSHAHRPRNTRQNTSSPTSVTTTQTSHRQNRPRAGSNADMNLVPAPPPPPTPPVTADPRAPTNVDPLTGQPGSPVPVQPLAASAAAAAAAGTPPVEHHRLSPRIPRRKNRRQTVPHLDPHDPMYSLLPPGILDGGVPPINVLIVEDNIINLKLLEQLAKRLKVRWQTAMNGRDAVTKWRAGGFHLVLMDIQLPIMSGLEATKEIRRLERVNGIGVFAKSEGERRESASIKATPTANGDANGTSGPHDGVNGASPQEDANHDKLGEDGIFKSPVIIVALTASSLQSDRHEALAAGCNDFLTKPVNFVWFERKVMEWGCMQALIDFDGWRRWKDQAAQEEQSKVNKEKSLDPEEKARREKKEKRRMELMAKMGQTAKG